MKRNKAHLDEMQEGMLLKTEERACWLGFWGLLAAILIQLAAGAAPVQIAGEAAVFALLSAYLGAMPLRNGLWSPSAVPDRRTNALVSLVPAAAVGALSALKAFVISRNAAEPRLLWQLAGTVAIAYAGCFAVLEGMRMYHRKRRAALDDEGGEREEPK